MKKAIWKGLVCVLVGVLLLMPVSIANNKGKDNEASTEGNSMVGKELRIVVESEREEVNPSTKSSVLLGENLAPNPSFEEGSGDMPDGWDFDDGGWDLTPSWGSSNAHSGSKSVGIADIRESGTHLFDGWYTTELIPVNPDEVEYCLGVWYKYTEEPNDKYNQAAECGVAMYDEDEISHFAQFYMMPYHDTNWHYFEVSCSDELTAETQYVRILLSHALLQGSVSSTYKIFFDDVFFGEPNPGADIEIDGVYAGFGHVSSIIKNTGEAAASDVYWGIDISLHQGQLFMGGSTSGTIASLPAGDQVRIRSSFIFGFGSGYAVVTAGGKRETTQCLILGPLVIIP